jgi:hypothetical protein
MTEKRCEEIPRLGWKYLTEMRIRFWGKTFNSPRRGSASRSIPRLGLNIYTYHIFGSSILHLCQNLFMKQRCAAWEIHFSAISIFSSCDWLTPLAASLCLCRCQLGSNPEVFKKALYLSLIFIYDSIQITFPVRTTSSQTPILNPLKWCRLARTFIACVRRTHRSFSLLWPRQERTFFFCYRAPFNRPLLRIRYKETHIDNTGRIRRGVLH